MRPKGISACWVYELIPYNTPSAAQSNAAVLKNWHDAVDHFTSGTWAEAYDAGDLRAAALRLAERVAAVHGLTSRERTP